MILPTMESAPRFNNLSMVRLLLIEDVELMRRRLGPKGIDIFRSAVQRRRRRRRRRHCVAAR